MNPSRKLSTETGQVQRSGRYEPLAEDLLLYLSIAALFAVINTSLSGPLISDFGAFLLTFLLPAVIVGAKTRTLGAPGSDAGR